MSAERERSRTAVVDTRGLFCPVPILRASEGLRRLPAGATLEVLADDPVILEDMPAFCRSHGHVYLGHAEVSPGVVRVRLRKGEDRRATR